VSGTGGRPGTSLSAGTAAPQCAETPGNSGQSVQEHVNYEGD